MNLDLTCYTCCIQYTDITFLFKFPLTTSTERIASFAIQMLLLLDQSITRAAHVHLKSINILIKS